MTNPRFAVLWPRENRDEARRWGAAPETQARDNAPITSRGYIGNSDSKVYHLPTCSYLPNRENQVSFSSKAKAESEGYRACQHCKP